MADLVPFTAVAFTATNSVRAPFYVPQILAVARSRNGARDIALATWFVFAVNNALGALFCAAVLGQRAMAWSFVGALLGCVTVLGLALWQRRRHRRAAGAAA